MPLSTTGRKILLNYAASRARFYGCTSFWTFWLWRICQILTVLGSAGAGLAAALKEYVAAMTLSSIATVAATLLTTMKFGEHHRIRDIALAGARKIYKEANIYIESTEVGSEDELKISSFLDKISNIEYDQVNLMKSLEGADLHSKQPRRPAVLEPE